MPILLAAGLSGCPGSPAPGPVGHVAERLFRGAAVITNDPARPRAEAVAVAAGRVLAVGDDGELAALAGPRTEVVDLAGSFILPGLVDAHAHLVGLADALVTVDLTAAPSYDAVLDRVRAAAQAQPEGWLLGRGWDQNDWPAKVFPRGQRLEEAAPGRAVWLRRTDGHAGLASPAALAAARIGGDTPDPDGGRIVREPRTGEPTGLLVDTAMEIVDGILPPVPEAERRRRLHRALARLAAVGLTGVHDMGVDAESLRLYRDLEAAGELPLRIYAVLAADLPDLEGFYAAGPQPGQRVTVRAVKLFVDGALGSRGAALLADYADEPGNRGLLLSSPATLQDAVARALAAGFQPCIHAIGDRANRLALDALEAATPPARAVRPRIEHAQVVAPADLARFAALGIVASMQPTHATSDMDWAEARLGPDRLAGAYAWRTLLRSGAVLAFGSDFPVERPEPLEGLYAAVSRRDRQGRPPTGWRPAERLSFAEALAAFTSGAAHAEFAEPRRGSIRPGRDADFTVLRGDLGPLVAGATDADPRALLEATVVMTVVDGLITYDAR